MLARIRNALDGLSPAERQVGEWVLGDPAHAAAATLQQWTAAIGVSDPTVVRFCKSVSGDAFAGFKRRLTASLAREETWIHQAVDPGDDAGALARKLFDSAAASLIAVRETLDTDALEGAIDCLAAAERVEIYGQGGSGMVAQDAQQKLFRLGKPVVAWSDPHVHRVSASLLDQTAVVLAISVSGETAELLDSVRRARDGGAPVIAITRSGSALARDADVALAVDVREDSDLYAPIKSRLAQLALLDVLAIGLAHRDPARSRARLQIASDVVRPTRP